MEKIISIRPTSQIIMLFEEIKVVDGNQESDRSAIFKRALETVVGNNVDWREVKAINVKEITPEYTIPEFVKLKVDEDKYCSALTEVKEAFSLERVKAPYLVKLVLYYYLTLLIKNDIASTVSEIANIGVDCLVFKNVFDISDYEYKESLLILSRKYLTDYDIELNGRLREQMDGKIRAYSDYFNREKYFPKPRSNFGTCDIRFISKSFAGLLLTLVETGSYSIEDIVQWLEHTLAK